MPAREGRGRFNRGNKEHGIGGIGKLGAAGISICSKVKIKG